MVFCTVQDKSIAEEAADNHRSSPVLTEACGDCVSPFVSFLKEKKGLTTNQQPLEIIREDRGGRGRQESPYPRQHCTVWTIMKRCFAIMASQSSLSDVA